MKRKFYLFLFLVLTSCINLRSCDAISMWAASVEIGESAYYGDPEDTVGAICQGPVYVEGVEKIKFTQFDPRTKKTHTFFLMPNSEVIVRRNNWFI
ncbi:hypothetical protein HN446_01700 [bacterium]|jgi:hypothetical protein|nr:hypothetical protein [bacterium]